MLTEFPRGVPFENTEASFPDARWWNIDELVEHEKWQYADGSVFLGSARGKPVGVRDDRHMLTCAGSRSGKGRSAIIPNLCVYTGSMMIIDPKGELATVTAARRGQGSEHCEGLNQSVYVLDPFEAAKGNAAQYRASLNPFDMIDPEGPNGRDDAALLADALIIPAGKERHWTDAAKLFLTGLILHICSTKGKAERNLITMRTLLCSNEDNFTSLLIEMAQSDIAGGVVARTANSLVAMSQKERSGVISTATVQTDFLDSPAMRGVLSSSDFSLSDLKEKRCSVYLSLPAGRMGTHSRWLRLMIGLTIEAMERNPCRPEDPVLIIMDEFPVLSSSLRRL